VSVNAFLQKLNKPEYWFRPKQLLAKMRFRFSSASLREAAVVRLPWGAELTVKRGDAIGRSLLTYGVYELAVSEVLWRLTDHDDWCLDVGANIGYMTGLLAAKSGKGGKCFSFEPHPAVFACLKTNIGDGLPSQNDRFSEVSLVQAAIGSANGDVDLVEPEGFDQNEGIAQLANGSGNRSKLTASHRVSLRTLDSTFNHGERFGIMKIDVEGAELGVLQGARNLLLNKCIRDIVFEDIQSFPSDCAQLLITYGYKVYRISKAIFRPVIWDPSDQQMQKRSLPWDPINYIATLDPARVEARLCDRGWRCLSGSR
jgi:FkbM family methyltransferase